MTYHIGFVTKMHLHVTLKFVVCAEGPFTARERTLCNYTTQCKKNQKNYHDNLFLLSGLTNFLQLSQV